MTLKLNMNQPMILGLCVSLGALVLLTLGLTVWHWHQDWVLAHQSLTSAPTIATQDETANLIASLPSTHLLGKSFAEGNLPITNLQLRVLGIEKVDDRQDGSASKAMISISGQPGKMFQVGDLLPYGVKVYDITADTVILESDGHLEKLPLPRAKLEFKPPPNEES